MEKINKAMRLLLSILSVILFSCNNETIIADKEKTSNSIFDNDVAVDTLKKETYIQYGCSNTYSLFVKNRLALNAQSNIIANIYGLDSVVYFSIDTNEIKKNRYLYFPTLFDTIYVLTQDTKPLRILVTHIMTCDTINRLFSTHENQPLNCDFGQYGVRGKILDENTSKELQIDVIFKMRQSFRLLSKDDFFRNNKQPYYTDNQFYFDFSKNEYTQGRSKNVLGKIELINYFDIDGHFFLLLDRIEEGYNYREVYLIYNDKLSLQYAYPIE